MADMQIVYQETIHEIDFSDLIYITNISGSDVTRFYQLYRGTLGSASPLIPQNIQIVYEYDSHLVAFEWSGTTTPSAWRPGVVFNTPLSQIQNDSSAPGLYRSISTLETFLSYKYMVDADTNKCILKPFSTILGYDGTEPVVISDYSNYIAYVPLNSTREDYPFRINGFLEEYRTGIFDYLNPQRAEAVDNVFDTIFKFPAAPTVVINFALPGSAREVGIISERLGWPEQVNFSFASYDEMVKFLQQRCWEYKYSLRYSFMPTQEEWNNFPNSTEKKRSIRERK